MLLFDKPWGFLTNFSVDGKRFFSLGFDILLYYYCLKGDTSDAWRVIFAGDLHFESSYYLSMELFWILLAELALSCIASNGFIIRLSSRFVDS